MHETLENQLLEQDIENKISAKEYKEPISENTEKVKKEVENNYEWKLLKLENLATQGTTYPEDTKMYIKSATTYDIIHFSNMEEDDFKDKNERLNKIFEKCFKVISGDKVLSYNDLCIIDKMSVLFAIRDYTFSNNPNELIGICTCTKCNKENKVPINFSNTNFFFPPKEFIDNYNPDKGCLSINIGPEELDIYFPVIGMGKRIEEYKNTRERKGHKVNVEYLKFLTFTEKNYRMDDTYIHNKITDMAGWSLTKISYLIKFIDLYEEGIRNTCYIKCVHCGAEGVSTTFRFQKGFRFKYFFLVQNIFGEPS